MKILRASHLGMCFGVRDAIAMARETLTHNSVTVLGPLVHNERVLAGLRREGVEFANSPEDVRTQTILITAHGASDRKLKEAAATGRQVLEATCPLVHYAHRELNRLVAAGYHPVIIGLRDHVEVKGLTEDLTEYDVVLTETDIAEMKSRTRLGVVAQTTQPVHRVKQLTDQIRQQFPDAEVVLRDTVCRPTKDRQTAAVELAQRCDVVVVIGGNRSNNTRELAATCQEHCARVHTVQSAKELDPTWFREIDTVGLTAGTSTPDVSIDEVEVALNALFELDTALVQENSMSVGWASPALYTQV